MLLDTMAVTEVMNLHIGILIWCQSAANLNGSRPLPIEFDYSSNLYRAIGENYQQFIRLISNEVDRHAPFHYRSWQEVPGDVKMSILTTLHENITDELNKAKSTSGGDDTPVDEVEVLERSLGQRRRHVRGVGRTVKTNARWAEQQHINEMMQQQINKLMSMQGGQGSSSFYYPRFETNQEKDQDQEEEDDEDEDGSE
ncbi:hypothetical protein R6Q57_029912 [Mikania cordata]